MVTEDAYRVDAAGHHELASECVPERSRAALSSHTIWTLLDNPLIAVSSLQLDLSRRTFLAGQILLLTEHTTVVIGLLPQWQQRIYLTIHQQRWQVAIASLMAMFMVAGCRPHVKAHKSSANIPQDRSALQALPHAKRARSADSRAEDALVRHGVLTLSDRKLKYMAPAGGSADL